MRYILIKYIVTAVLVVIISEVAKRYSLFGALLASLPLTSILAMVWLYNETEDVTKVANLSYDIFWLVIPSLTFFMVFPWLLKKGLDFYLSMGVASIMTASCYFLMFMSLTRYGMK
jgi:hypothetical protein